MGKRRLGSKGGTLSLGTAMGTPSERAGFENGRWRKVMRKNTRFPVIFEFRINYNFFFAWDTHKKTTYLSEVQM